jgi:hypothetical protein
MLAQGRQSLFAGSLNRGINRLRKNMKINRNRFIRFRLYSIMRFLIALLILIPAQAINLKDFNARPPAEQSGYVVNFIDKMASDLGAKNPQLGQSIRDYFSRKMEGKPVSEGIERLYVELGAVEIQAKDGRADLSKIQLESVIVWVVKQKFPPPAR